LTGIQVWTGGRNSASLLVEPDHIHREHQLALLNTGYIRVHGTFAMLNSVAPFFIVDDLGATLAFYQSKLGSTFFISVVVMETEMMTTSP
jgi:hypothetical protein